MIHTFLRFMCTESSESQRLPSLHNEPLSANAFIRLSEKKLKMVSEIDTIEMPCSTYLPSIWLQSPRLELSNQPGTPTLYPQTGICPQTGISKSSTLNTSVSKHLWKLTHRTIALCSNMQDYH